MTQRTGKDVRDILLASCLPLGYLRWISLREKLSLKFEDLDFTQFIQKETLSIDQPRFVQTVKNKSQGCHVTQTQLAASLTAIRNIDHDPWHVCCGHDLVSILSIGLRKAIGTLSSSDSNPDILARSLRLAIESSHFYKTNLYVSIQAWEKANTPFVILPSEQ